MYEGMVIEMFDLDTLTSVRKKEIFPLERAPGQPLL